MGPAAGATKASPPSSPDEKLDRLRRIRLRAAKQDDLRPGPEQGRQVHQAGPSELSGGGERRLAEGEGLLPADDGRPRGSRYPIAATAFVVMAKKPKNPARSKSAFEFFRWALEKGQKQATDLD